MESLTYLDGEWIEGNPPIIGAMSHAAWLGSVVFDGARAFDGVTPDLARHCERAIASTLAMGMRSPIEAGNIHDLALAGVAKFAPGTALYIRPTLFAETGLRLLAPDPESTRFYLTLWAAEMPPATGFSAGLSSFRRPTSESAPTDAKASCHYPNGARAVNEAAARGFDNAVVLDINGMVAEFATSNLFMVKDGVCMTPFANGTFLNGITRQRVIKLLQDDGTKVVEASLRPRDLAAADEIFSTGNYGKVQPVIRYEDHVLQPGPVYRRARELYMDFAHS
ncbi:MAG: branched-chain amino acid aminotransferase [Alphaproteobacteria bacterium]